MKITKSIVDRDYETLKDLRDSMRAQFPHFAKWYVEGRKWMRDVDGKKGIDDIFGKFAKSEENFTYHHAPIEEWLLLSINHPVDETKYSARVTAALDALVSMEDVCRTIQTREQLLGVFSAYVSKK